MEIQSLEEVVDYVRSAAVVANPVEDIAGRLHRQRGDDWTPAMSGDSGDARGDAETRRLSPNSFLVRWRWRTDRAIEVFPIPPGPMRAIGVRFSARPTIFPISSSRPKQLLGGGGEASPVETLCKSKTVDPMVFKVADLV